MRMRITRLTIFVAMLLGCLLASAPTHSAPNCETYQSLVSGQSEWVNLSIGEMRCFEIFVAGATMLNVNIESNRANDWFDLYVGYEDDPTNSPAISFGGSTDLVYPVWMDGYWRFALAGKSNNILQLRFRVTLAGAPEVAASEPAEGVRPLETGFTRIPINDPSRPDSITLGQRAMDKVIFPLKLTGPGRISAEVYWQGSATYLEWNLRDPKGAVKAVGGSRYSTMGGGHNLIGYTVSNDDLKQLGDLWSLELFNGRGGVVREGKITMHYPGDVPIALNKMIRATIGGSNYRSNYKFFLPNDGRLHILLDRLSVPSNPYAATLPVLRARYAERPKGDSTDWVGAGSADKEIFIENAKSGWYYIEVNGYGYLIAYNLIVINSAPIAAGPAWPSGTIATSMPTYTWKLVNGSTHYKLWVKGPLGKIIIDKWYKETEICSGGICQVTPSVTLINGAYQWRIRTWNPIGYGPWSAMESFTVRR